MQKRTLDLTRWGLPTSALRFIENKNPQWIIGADEVGYGALAGPFAVGAFLAPITWVKEGVKDSKKFHGKSAAEKHAKRVVVEKVLLAEPMTASCVFYATNLEIDAGGRIPVLGALFERAIRHLLQVSGFDPTSEVLTVLDGEVRIPLPHHSMPKADVHVPAVSAASILAKTARDRWMFEQHMQWPHYAWNENAGYGTPDHLEALRKFGPCALHRRSYEPIRTMTRFTTT